MRIFVAGSSGQLARTLAGGGGPAREVIAVGRPDLDICDRASIARAIESAGKIDMVVNAAAYTAVDKAESEPEAAFAVNRDGAGNLAAAAAARHLPIVHLSTDYVYPGDKPAPYVETDETAPTGIYGLSKLEGERAVEAANPRHLIFRTAWVYSEYGRNFLKTMLRLARSRDDVTVVSDQCGNPTYAGDLAEAILHAANSILAGQGFAAWGTYHVSGKSAMSWAGFARRIFEVSKALGGPFATVRDISASDYPTAAERPANSRLDNAKFRRQFGWEMPETDRSIEVAIRGLPDFGDTR